MGWKRLLSYLSRVRVVYGDTYRLEASWPFSWTGYVKPMEPKLIDVMLLEREWFTDKSTIGRLSFDGEHVCFTLEDTCRKVKENGKTAIPSGRYEITIDFSERFQKQMPHILDVPLFEGVRIHAGNTAENTDGCLLVGLRHDVDVIYDSQKAYSLVLAELEKRLAKGKVFLSVVGGISQENFKA